MFGVHFINNKKERKNTYFLNNSVHNLSYRANVIDKEYTIGKKKATNLAVPKYDIVLTVSNLT
jgi:hypothetical protein